MRALVAVFAACLIAILIIARHHRHPHPHTQFAMHSAEALSDQIAQPR